MKGHSAGVTTEKSMRNDFFFFAIRSPNFSSFLFPYPLLFFSSCLYISTARLFWLRWFGLGGVALSRQYGKLNFLKAKILPFFYHFGGFYCASYTCWPADIHITYSLCAVLNLQICFDICRCEGRSKSVWRQLRMITLLPLKRYTE